MPNYYANMITIELGVLEVHKDGCSHMPNLENLLYLGSYSKCAPAVEKAKETNPKADGCFWCSTECHTS